MLVTENNIKYFTTKFNEIEDKFTLIYSVCKVKKLERNHNTNIIRNISFQNFFLYKLGNAQKNFCPKSRSNIFRNQNQIQLHIIRFRTTDFKSGDKKLTFGPARAGRIMEL